MAMKFLNKKGWHPSNLRNVEKVWKAEQKEEAEKKKLEELRKQIQEDQKLAELQQLREQAGLVPLQQRVDFLYESGLSTGKDSAEEYLLGAKKAELTADANQDLSKDSSAPGALFAGEAPQDDKPVVPNANEMWQRMHSDPLLLIKQQEQQALSRIRSNPVQMAMIRKEAEQKNQRKMEKEERKRKKEEKKKARKERKRLKAEAKERGEEGKGERGSRRKGDRDETSSGSEGSEEEAEGRGGKARKIEREGEGRERGHSVAGERSSLSYREGPGDERPRHRTESGREEYERGRGRGEEIGGVKRVRQDSPEGRHRGTAEGQRQRQGWREEVSPERTRRHQGSPHRETRHGGTDRDMRQGSPHRDRQQGGPDRRRPSEGLREEEHGLGQRGDRRVRHDSPEDRGPRGSRGGEGPRGQVQGGDRDRVGGREHSRSNSPGPSDRRREERRRSPREGERRVEKERVREGHRGREWEEAGREGRRGGERDTEEPPVGSRKGASRDGAGPAVSRRRHDSSEEEGSEEEETRGRRANAGAPATEHGPGGLVVRGRGDENEDEDGEGKRKVTYGLTVNARAPDLLAQRGTGAPQAGSRGEGPGGGPGGLASRVQPKGGPVAFKREKLSEEEKARRFAEMSREAQRNDTEREERLRWAARKEKDEERREAEQTAHKSFIINAKKNVYGATGDSGTIEGSIKRRSHYLEKGTSRSSQNAFRR